MAGYANRVITNYFDDLSEPGDRIWVTIRNPKTVPAEELDAHGSERPGDTSKSAGAYRLMSFLIVGWHVYDATSIDSNGDMALMTDVTPDNCRKLPSQILVWFSEQVQAVNPPKPTGDQEAGISRT